jgi:diguanylate cyclase (GGDEF)-like protein
MNVHRPAERLVSEPTQLSTEMRGPRRVLWLSFALAAGCAGLLAATGHRSAAYPVPSLALALLAAGFACSELLVIHIPVRRDTHTASFSEIPLTIGLFLVTPYELVGAALVGTAAALWFHRRQRGVKFVFNLTQVAAQAVIALATFELLASHHDLGTTRVIVAAIAAMLAADFASAILVNTAIGLFRGEWPGLGMFELLGGAVGCLAKSALALLAVASIRDKSPAELSLVCVCGATMYLAFRVYARAHERYVRLEMLYRFRESVAASVKVDEIAQAVVAEACDILRAESSQLLVVLEGGSSMLWTATADGAVAGNNADGREPGVDVGVATATELSLPIELQSGARAWLSVRQRLGIGGSFDDVDARLFEALANQAAVALQNGQLVEQLEQEVREREHAATHDQLTGLPNRVSFTELLTATLATGERRAVFVIGLDDFSRVNETVGHDNGDRVLREVSDRISNAIAGAIVSRLGGDEFGVLTPSITSDAEVAAMHEKLAAAVGRNIEVDALPLELRASVGAALAPDHARNGVVLLRFADTAMRKAKARHSRFEIHDGEAETDSRRRLVLAHDLRRAIEEKRVEAHFQPQLCLASGRVTGVEALARWSHQAFGFVSPEEFVSIAEHTGLIDALTVHVLERALRHRRIWAARSIELRTAVNVSARSLSDQRFPDLVARALLRHRCPADGLTIEITESQLMAETDRVAEVLTSLHEIGVRVSIDDLGTGFSSLSSLRNLPIDEIKIDKSFVLGVTENENDAEIVRSMTALGHSLGLHVVAEGVEDGATAAFLAHCGVDTVQGFYYARPKPPEELACWLLEQRARRDCDQAKRTDASRRH